MPDTRYKITMDGSLVPGVSLTTAQENFARIFKAEVSSIKRLFHSGPTVIKRNISSAEADKYVQVLRAAGVIAEKQTDLAAGLSLQPTADEHAAHGAKSPVQMTCPKCSAVQPSSDICQSCGIVIAKFNHRQAAHNNTATISPYATPKAIIEQEPDHMADISIWGIEGRLGRMRFIAWSLVLMLAMAPAMLFGTLIMQSSMMFGGFLIVAMALLVSVVAIQFSVKRLHDIGWSGWLLLVSFVPVLGSIFQLLILLLPGSKGNNRYGAAPPANSTAVKVLFWLWVIFLLSGLLLAVLGGFMAGVSQHYAN